MGIVFNQVWYQSTFVNAVCDREWILGGARTRSAALTSTWSWHGAGQRWAQPGNGRWQGCLQGGHEPEWHLCCSRDEWWQDEGFLQGEENNEKQIIVFIWHYPTEHKSVGHMWVPAQLLTAWRFSASLSSTGHRDHGRAAITPNFNHLRTRITAAWHTHNSTSFLESFLLFSLLFAAIRRDLCVHAVEAQLLFCNDMMWTFTDIGSGHGCEKSGFTKKCLMNSSLPRLTIPAVTHTLCLTFG